MYRGLEKTDLAIHYIYHASILHRGEFLPRLFRTLAYAYLNIGFPEKARFYNLQALQLNRDTTSYFYTLGSIEANYENYEDAIGYFEDANAIDTSRTYGNIFLNIAYNNLWLGRFEESLKNYKKYEAEMKALKLPIENHLQRIGYVYWQLGMKSEADFYFDEQIRISS